MRIKLWAASITLALFALLVAGPALAQECNYNSICEPGMGETQANCSDCHCNYNMLCEPGYGESMANCSDCYCNYNSTCEPMYGENEGNCSDCVCDYDAICESGNGETQANCSDCVCDYDAICESAYGENEANCPLDCTGGGGCNYNGFCEPGNGENYTNCMSDCHCGNGTCDWDPWMENLFNCPADCHCGNNICEPEYGESTPTCMNDCPPLGDIRADGPGDMVTVGNEFEVAFKMTVGAPVRSYDFTLNYDPTVMQLETVMGSTSAPEVMYQDMMGQVRIFETGVTCSNIGQITLAHLRFKANPAINMGATYYVSFSPGAYLADCSLRDISSALPPSQQWTPAAIQTKPLSSIVGAPQMRGYLDLTGDYYMTEADIGQLRKVLSGEVQAGDSTLLATSARQCDINGNAQFDSYDSGRLDALVRPARFISSGTDGVCNTSAAATDVQEKAVGMGESQAVVIDPGPNGILQTTPAAGDVVSGSFILVGPNFKADTPSPVGDDVQMLALGTGVNVVCVSAGSDYTLETTPNSGDYSVVHEKQFNHMMLSHPQRGVPARMLLVSPAYLLPHPYVISRIQSIPITVQVLDARGRPKTGVSPVFTRTIGTGTFPANGQSSIGQIPTDYFSDKQGATEGEVSVNFMPSLGLNQVVVSLDGDTSKGIPDLPDLTVDIVVLDQSAIEPDHFTISANPANAFVGDTVELTLTLKDGNTPVNGHADRILLMSERNLQMGVDPTQPSADHPQPIFYDNFESGTLESGWSLAPADGSVGNGTDNVSVFGSKSARLTCGTPGSGLQSIWRKIVTTGFRNIQLSFQWFFYGAVTTDMHVLFEYSANGVTWKKLKYVTGSALVGGKWIGEKFNLTPDTTLNNNQVYIRFSTWAGAGGSCPESLHLDELSVSGQKTLLNETFESRAEGSFPGVAPFTNQLSPSTFITTGPDGIRDTAALSDDYGRIALGNGEPDVPYIFAGPDNVLNTSTIGGDDQKIGLEITTGANGRAETFAAAGDFQEIPYLQGQPYSISILPGSSLIIHSIRANDDELIGNIGPHPQIAVTTAVPGTSTNFGANGSLKFLSLGRTDIGENGAMGSYSFMAKVNLEGISNAELSFYHLSPFQMDYSYTAVSGGVSIPAQYYAVEVSDNGGKSWVRVWENAGRAYTTWTQQKIKLHGDPRFNLTKDFIIKWTAIMNSTSSNVADRDGVYFDNIVITSVAAGPDTFGPVIDMNDGNGTYKSYLYSIIPGNSVKVSAAYWQNNNQPLYAHPAANVNVNFHKALPETIQVLPSTFTLKACESLKLSVVGRYTTTPEGRLEDMTRFFRFDVNGPARQTGIGEITADCFVGSASPHIQVYAKPLITGLFDPGGGGGGQQTGDVSGRIYRPNLTGAPLAPVWIDLGSGNVQYQHGDADGWYLFQALPAGSGYTLYASLSGYKRKTRTAVSVTAGENTTVNATILTGADFDADGTNDSSDTDDDNDSVLDTSEYNTAARTDPDYDGDGIPDDDDLFPGNSTESADNDLDSIGDNADTDDDNDGVLDSEEIVVGADGYITNQFLADTDSDGMPDGWETNPNNATNPTVNDASSDKDSDGLTNLYEYQNGLYANDSDYDDDGLSDGYEVYTSLTDPKDSDHDNDGVSDGLEVNTYHSNPKDTDSDDDGLSDLIETITVSCLMANTVDSDGDGLCDGNVPAAGCVTGEDLDLDGTVDTGETNPCSADTDADGMPDGWEDSYGLDPLAGDSLLDADGDGLSNLDEFNEGTYPNDWDYDNDGLPDGYEVLHGSSLDPLVAEGATADDDHDGNPNVHEYWNGTNPWSSDPVGDEGCFFWGEGDGDGIVGPGDKSALVSVTKGSTPSSYADVVPNTGETQEMDMDGIPGPGDISIIVQMMKGTSIPTLLSRPTEIARVYPGDGDSVSMQVGETTHIVVKVNNGKPGEHTPGLGVVFTRHGSSTANATIFGGDGREAAGNRYDISADIDSGESRTVIRADSSGVIYVQAWMPQCGTEVNVGKYSPALELTSMVKIHVSP